MHILCNPNATMLFAPGQFCTCINLCCADLFGFQLESSCVSIHEVLKVVIDSQTRYRLMEAHDRSKAEHLLERVTFWSVGETIVLFAIGIGQVMLLKSFFSDKKGSVAATT